MPMSSGYEQKKYANSSKKKATKMDERPTKKPNRTGKTSEGNIGKGKK